MIYIGIDPRKNGGISFMEDGNNSSEAYPYSDDVLINNLGLIYAQGFQNAVICYLEHVHAMPKQGVSSTFNFGVNFSCTSDKNTSIEVCKRLFPGVNLKATDRCKKDHDGMAEALLIAEYGRRHYNGKP